jgi:hypothetical protein
MRGEIHDMHPYPVPNDVLETTQIAFHEFNRSHAAKLKAATCRLSSADAERLGVPKFSFSLVTLDLITLVELLGALRRIETRAGKHATFGLMPLERASAAWAKLLEQVCEDLPEKSAEMVSAGGESDRAAA